MQVNVAGLRRNIKNLAHNYSDAQVKVREATSNDPWGPSAAIMAEIADLTYNVVAFSEIMQMIWKRLNDHGKNWRHVYKALILLEYLIKTGTEKVAQQCKENIFAIQTLREFVYYEEGKDQGTHVREKAKQLVNLLKDDERLKNERFKALKAKERFAQHPSGFGSDGYIDGPSQRDMPPGWQEDPKPLSDLELVRPQTAGEEELQLKLAMAMSREEAEQEEAKRRSDDVRLQLALSQSEQDFKEQQVVRQPKREEPQSHLLDLLDISLGAASISSPPLGATGGLVGGPDPWVSGQARAASQLSDPWSGTSSPQIDPWQPAAMAMRSNTSSVPLGASTGAMGGLSGATGTNGDAWALRTQSPSIASGSSTEGWLQTNGGAGAGAAAVAINDAVIVPKSLANVAAEKSLTLDDPWAPKTAAAAADDPWKNLESTGAIKKTSPDLDEFDIISNRKKTAGDLLTDELLSGSNNNNITTETATTNGKKPLKTPQAFLGENSSLVNLDNLIKPIVPQTQPGSAAYNPFSDTVIPPKTNLFQQQQPAVPSINQLKQQQPFAMAAVNADPWAPISNVGNVSQQVKENPFIYELDGILTRKTSITTAAPNSKDRYSALSEPITTESVFDLKRNQNNSTENDIDLLFFYCNNKNDKNSINNNNGDSFAAHLYPRNSDSDDDVFSTAYVPYNFLNNSSSSCKNINNNNNSNKNICNNNNQNQIYKLDSSSTTTTATANDVWHRNSHSNIKNDVDVNQVFSSNLTQNDIYANSKQHGGSLFNYGFYDTNQQRNNDAAAATTSTTAFSFVGCNNNNMAWNKPEAASSNPFLS